MGKSAQGRLSPNETARNRSFQSFARPDLTRSSDVRHQESALSHYRRAGGCRGLEADTAKFGLGEADAPVTTPRTIVTRSPRNDGSPRNAAETPGGSRLRTELAFDAEHGSAHHQVGADACLRPQCVVSERDAMSQTSMARNSSRPGRANRPARQRTLARRCVVRVKPVGAWSGRPRASTRPRWPRRCQEPL